MSTQKAPNNRIRNLKFQKSSKFRFLKSLEKITKTSYLENYKDLSSHNWIQGSQPWEYSDSPQLQGLEFQILKIN